MITRALAHSQETVNRMAFVVWGSRPPSQRYSPDADWAEAQRLLRDELTTFEPLLAVQKSPEVDAELEFRAWASRTLKPFLAIRASDAPMAVAESIKGFASPSAVAADAVVIVVADGSPEFARNSFRRHHLNGVLPERTVNVKDDLFCRLTAGTIALYGGQFVGFDPREGPAKRQFQDGYAVAFGGPDGVTAAISATIRMRRVLATYNEEENLPWTDQLHVRTSLGRTWFEAISSVPGARRNEVILSRGVLSESDRKVQSICLAAGMRIRSESHSIKEHGHGSDVVSEYVRRVR